MPKRKKTDKERIEKLEKRIRRIKRKRENDDVNCDGGGEAVPTCPTSNLLDHDDHEILDENEIINEEDLMEDCEQVLDLEILEALGEPQVQKPNYGPPINSDLATRWSAILEAGCEKEVKEGLITAHKIPENCPLMGAPKLNLEMVAAIPDAAKNRDFKIASEQNQLGMGITALNKGLTELIKPNSQKLECIKLFSEATRILCDLHYNQTMTRRRLISVSLDKKFVEHIKDNKRTDYLFGTDVGDKIRAVRELEKSGKSLLKTPNTGKLTGPGSGTNNDRARPGNYQGPPRYQPRTLNRGGLRRTQPFSYNRRPPPPSAFQPQHPPQYPINPRFNRPRAIMPMPPPLPPRAPR